MSDLSTPLGLNTTGSEKRRRPVRMFASVFVVAAAAAVGVYLIAVDDPLGGEPSVTATIQEDNGGAGNPPAAVGSASNSSATRAPIDQSADIGAGDDLAARPSRGGGITVTLPDGTVQSLSLPTGPLEALEEDGPYGRLPQVADSGLRPIDAYSRPVPGFVGASPKIVVIVGGLGLSQTGTQEALRQLPPDVTLAFAPYGSSLDRWTARARQEGHELLLQLPMEPFDYPENDPGPQTLITSAPVEQNIDSLYWLMARIGTYVGVVTYMGARFTADAEALEPVMAEIASRGLMFVDDGSSLRTRSAEAAASFQTPYARADIVVDTVADAEEIAGRLAQLEQIARTRGIAVGVASALPISVRSIGDWAATLEAKGITLVPVSATLSVD